MIVAAPPPVQVQADLGVQGAAVGVWGEEAALERLRQRMEGVGWAWVTALLGDVTPALFLWTPAGAPSDARAELIEQINAGSFGKLNAGYAIIDRANAAPAPHPARQE